MDNPPSPYPDEYQPGQSSQAQESEMLYGYPHAAGFPQPGYPPTQPMYPPTQPGYMDEQMQAGYAETQPAGYMHYTNSMGTQRPAYLPLRRSWNSLGIALTTLALLLLVTGGSLYYYFLIRSTPQKTLQAYCSAIKSEDSQALYNTYSSEARTQTDAPHLQQDLRLIEFLSGGIEDCTVDNNSIRENDPQASASVMFTLYNGRVNSAILHLIDENGQWKIENNAILP